MPKEPTDGEMVYEGTEDNFTDTKMEDDVSYYYTIFQSTCDGKKLCVKDFILEMGGKDR